MDRAGEGEWRPGQVQREPGAEGDPGGPSRRGGPDPECNPDVESGDLETQRANALATLARAYVSVYEAGLVEAWITELEAKIAGRVA